MMQQDKPRDGELEPLARRIDGLDVGALPERLSALDNEKRRRGDSTHAELDATGCEQTLGELSRLSEDADLQQTLEARRTALIVLQGEVTRKLEAARSREDMALGLRRLADAVYAERSFPVPGSASDELRKMLAGFDEQFRSLQARARQLLAAQVSLEMMPDQTGRLVDPHAHNVVGSEVCESPSLDGTVAHQEAPGWLLDGEVLVPAEVVRYSARSGGLPGLPSLDGLGGGLDQGMLGTKKT